MPDEKSGTNKIWSFIKSGVRNSLFTRDRDKTHTNERLMENGIGLFIAFKDFFALIGSGLVLMFYYLIGIFFSLKSIPSQLKNASKNNFHLGIEALKANNLLDARIRFLLADMFFSKSPTIKYYIAFTYCLGHKHKKSLKYLKKAIDIDPENKRCIALVSQIEKELNENKDTIQKTKTQKVKK